MTAGFKTDVLVQLRKDGQWELLEPLVWQGSQGDSVVVEAGAVTDFASVPRWLQSLLPSAATYVVRAAIVHDELCNRQKKYWYDVLAWRESLVAVRETGDERWRQPRPVPPEFNSVDTDAVFEKIMIDEGAGWLSHRVGWLGVRLGALSPHRRQGWLSTLPRVARLSLAFLGAALAALALIGWAIPW